MKKLTFLIALIPSLAVAEPISPERAQRLEMENQLIRSITERNVAETQAYDEEAEYYHYEAQGKQRPAFDVNGIIRQMGRTTQREMELDRIERESR